jgi:Kef-type K+ transport system membrane component KefB
VLFAAALLGAIARRLGLPAIVAYLLVGLAVGPFTPGYVVERHQLELLAEVGVIFLLFEVGIELDVRALRRDEPPGLLVAAPVQVVLGIAIGSGLTLAAGVAAPGADNRARDRALELGRRREYEPQAASGPSMTAPAARSSCGRCCRTS